VFGVGAGWNIEELRNHGTDPKTRGALLDERIETIKALWTTEPAEYHGKYVDFDSSYLRPKPVQKPHPPIYIGGDSDATVKRVIRHEAGWISNPLPVEHLSKRIGQIREGAGAVRHSRGPRLLARRRGPGFRTGGAAPAHQAALRIASVARRVRRVGRSVSRLAPRRWPSVRRESCWCSCSSERSVVFAAPERALPLDWSKRRSHCGGTYLATPRRGASEYAREPYRRHDVRRSFG
jgi:hypothetical protein